MRILVTGGAGYIGSITVRHLLDHGHAVVVLDSLERGHALAVDARARLVQGSVSDAGVLDELLPDVDAVLHCAGYIDVAESQKDPGLYYRKNLSEPARLIERMIFHGVPNIVFSSTAAVYGQPEQMPITEDAPRRPVNAYGSSKLAFEQLIEHFCVTGRLEAVRLRYFNVAGAWPDGSMGEAHDPETHIVPRLFAAAASRQAVFTLFGDDYPTPDGTCVRDYIHVLDLAEAHRLALEHLDSGGGSLVCNLGSGCGYSNLEVVRTCSDIAGRAITVVRGPRRDGDPAMLVASIDRARRALGWSPTRGLREMVRDAWAWHLMHPHGYDGFQDGLDGSERLTQGAAEKG